MVCMKQMRIRARIIRALIYSVLIVSILLVVGQFLLEAIILKKVNTSLGGSYEFTGHVDDVYVNILEGEYELKSLVLQKKVNDRIVLKCRADDLEVFIHPKIFANRVT